MKHKILIILMMVSFLKSNAQRNRIEIGVGNYKIYNVVAQPDDLISQVQFTYSRNINNQLRLFSSYLRMPLNSRYLAIEEYLMSKEAVGKIENRGKYNYFDLGGAYKLWGFKNHTFSLSAALSLTYGENSYLTHVVWSDPKPGELYGRPFHADYDKKMESYFGGVAGLRYDYTFWKNRINIGVDIAARHYFGKKNAKLENPHPNTQVSDPNIPGGRNNFPFQINYGIHVGYNF